MRPLNLSPKFDSRIKICTDDRIIAIKTNGRVLLLLLFICITSLYLYYKCISNQYATNASPKSRGRFLKQTVTLLFKLLNTVIASLKICGVPQGSMFGPKRNVLIFQ